MSVYFNINIEFNINISRNTFGNKPVLLFQVENICLAARGASIALLWSRPDLVCQNELFFFFSPPLRLVSYGALLDRNGLRRSCS